MGQVAEFPCLFASFLNGYVWKMFLSASAQLSAHNVMLDECKDCTVQYYTANFHPESANFSFTDLISWNCSFIFNFKAIFAKFSIRASPTAEKLQN